MITSRRTQRRRPTQDRGFTLVEILVVIALIGILAGLVIASVTSSRRVARDRKRIADLQLVHGALQAYVRDGNPLLRPIDYGESGSLACGSTTQTVPTGGHTWDCSFEDLNGNGASFVDFLQSVSPNGCPDFAKEVANCPYLPADARDPLYASNTSSNTYKYLYYAHLTTPVSIEVGCQKPYYVLVALLETDGVSQARNDTSCWTWPSYKDDPKAYMIVGR